MSWPLREIPFPFTKPYEDIDPGECWRISLDYQDDGDAMYEDIWSDLLSPEFRQSGRRYVWQIAMPTGAHWSPDFRASNENSGWMVTGAESAETLTARPSIDINSGLRYHGWLTNGVLTDDCEGRTF